MSRRVNKKHRAKRDGQNRDGAVRRNRKSIRAATKMTKGMLGTVRKNGAPIRSRRAPAFRNPKTELEAAIQRFVDLYDFAPIAYVSFDRAGRIEEANLVATELLGEPRDRLIGRPFAFYVGDLDLFLRHLLYCRTSQQQVETELELKPRKGVRIPALLCSRPITSRKMSCKSGTSMFGRSSLSGRPMSVGKILKAARAAGVARRTVNALSTITIGI